MARQVVAARQEVAAAAQEVARQVVAGVNLHLVGGFLGSGKTTTIIHAARSLMDQGRRVGIITNDQGRYLVDTAFARLSAIPTVEVSGGCFCCNYASLDAQLAQLIADAQPDAIFAESVGSCADMVATVVRPLLALGQARAQPASFSVFADARLLKRRLAGQELPFREDVVYIFDKQIEESGLLVINKADLLGETALAELCDAAGRRYPQKTILTQSALTQAGVQPWLDWIRAAPGIATYPLEIDYQRYGAGEAQLAWLDAEIALAFPRGTGRQALQQVLARLQSQLRQQAVGIGHVKFLIQTPEVGQPGGAKISLPTLEETGWEALIPEIAGETALLLVNARVEMPAPALRAVLHAALEASALAYAVRGEEAFHPGQPNPLHRF